MVLSLFQRLVSSSQNGQTEVTTAKKYIEMNSTIDAAKYSFYVRTIPQWNNLSEEIVSAPTLDIFKSRLAEAY